MTDKQRPNMKLSDGNVAETEPMSDGLFFDIAADGTLAGIEVIVRGDMPGERVKKLLTLTK